MENLLKLWIKETLCVAYRAGEESRGEERRAGAIRELISIFKGSEIDLVFQCCSGGFKLKKRSVSAEFFEITLSVRDTISL